MVLIYIRTGAVRAVIIFYLITMVALPAYALDGYVQLEQQWDDGDEQTSTQLLDLQQQWSMGTMTLALENHDDETQLSIKELAYLDILAGWDASAGKLYLPWDWSYSRQPLDLFGNDDDPLPSGDWLVAADYRHGLNTLTLACSEGAAQKDPWTRTAGLCAVRMYQVFAALEWQWLAYAMNDPTDATTIPGAGVGWTWVGTDALELHGSLRWQSRYWSATTELQEQSQRDGWLALFGGHYNGRHNWQWLLEAHYDSSGWSQRQWQAYDLWLQQLDSSAIATVEQRMDNPWLYRYQIFTRLDWDPGWFHPEAYLFWQPQIASSHSVVKINMETDHELALSLSYGLFQGPYWPYDERIAVALEFSLSE